MDNDDSDDTHAAIDRIISVLKTSGIGDDTLASVMMARAIFHFRAAGWTDDEIASEFAEALAVPLGRN